MTIGPNPPAGATAPIRAVWREVHARFGGVVSSAGVAVCRRISGSTTWSQHAWGNAWDITGSVATLDRVAAFLRSPAMRPHVAQVLWRVPDHYGHIHVSGRPMFVGTPPCAGGAIALGVTTPSEVRVTIPQVGELVSSESWAPALRVAARQLERRANRIARVPQALGRILARG